MVINGDEDYEPGQIRTDFWDHSFSLMRLWWIDKRCPRSILEAHLGIPWISLYWVLITTVIHSPTSLLQKFIKDDRRQMSVNYTQQVWESWVSVNLSWPAFFSPLFVTYLQFLPLWPDTWNQAFIINLHYIHSWALYLSPRKGMDLL